MESTPEGVFTEMSVQQIYLVKKHTVVIHITVTTRHKQSPQSG